MKTTEVLVSPPLFENVLSYTMTGKLAGYDMGVPANLPFDIMEIFNLRHSNWEALHVSRAFRSVIGVREERSTRLFGLANHDQKRALLLGEISTEDAGRIPIIYGATEIFPMYLDEIIKLNEDLINSSNIMRIVEQGHEESILTNLSGYVLPDRLARNYKKAGYDLTLTRVETSEDLFQLYKSSPYADSVDIQTKLYYAGLLTQDLDDHKQQKLEEIYRRFHNHMDEVRALCYIYTCDVVAPEPIENEFMLYKVEYQGSYLGHAQMQRKGNDWYWVNTNRLRIRGIESELGFNINNAIISALINEAQSKGAETFNLGAAYYDYKDQYKPERIWRPGLRYGA